MVDNLHKWERAQAVCGEVAMFWAEISGSLCRSLPRAFMVLLTLSCLPMSQARAVPIVFEFEGEVDRLNFFADDPF